MFAAAAPLVRPAPTALTPGQFHDAGRRQAGAVATITELAVVVVPPRVRLAVGGQRQRDAARLRDLDHVVEADDLDGHVRRGRRAVAELAGAVAPPGPDAAVAFDRVAAERLAAGAERDDVGQAGDLRREGRAVGRRSGAQRALVVAAPRPHGAVGLERVAGEVARADRGDVGQALDDDGVVAAAHVALAELALLICCR